MELIVIVAFVVGLVIGLMVMFAIMAFVNNLRMEAQRRRYEELLKQVEDNYQQLNQEYRRPHGNGHDRN